MSVTEFPVLEQFPAHRHLLERAVAHFQPDPRVVGLAVSGSIATGEMDFYSDIDLEVVVRDEDFDAVFAERDKIAEQVGNPLFRFDADHLPFENHFYIVLYPGAVKLDFMYERASGIQPGWGWLNCLILKDSDGLLAQAKAASQGTQPAPPDPESLLALNQKFWTWCWYVFGKIVRGELWEALDGIHGIRSMALLPMLAWTTGGRPEGFRRLERKIDPTTADRVAATAAMLQSEGLYAALLAEMALFRELRACLFDRYGLTADPAAEQALEEVIAQHWSIREKEQGTHRGG